MTFDLARGVTQLAVDAVAETSRIVEALHATVAAAPLPFGKGPGGETSGLTGLTYRALRRIDEMIGAALDGTLRLAASLSPAPAEPAERWSRAQSILNGVVGDHLARSANPLAIRMHFRCEGRPLSAPPTGASGRIAVMIHGLCMSELEWTRQGHDHGAMLASELGYATIYLRYNSGRSVAENGSDLAALLEELYERWPVPVEELALVAHSMGGLVARSAVHHASLSGRRWPSRLRKLVFLGTPHHGAPLERAGLWLQRSLGRSPYVEPIARLGRLRSAGITDLRFGNLLADDGAATDRFEHAYDRRVAIPLPVAVACYAVAGALGGTEQDVRTRLLGDGLVPVASALGRHFEPTRALAFDESRAWIAAHCNHWDLLDRADVAAKLREWLSATTADLSSEPA